MATASIDKRIEQAIEAERWSDARRLIIAALRETPDDHWLLTRLGTTYYEQHDYAKSLHLSEKALAVQPRCPLALWDYAGSLDMLGKVGQAIDVWRTLVDRGASSLAADECGEGLRWAAALVNDCRYRIALAYRDKGEPRRALVWLRQHLRHRGPGISSIYTIAEARRELESLTNNLRPRHGGTPRRAAS